MRVGIILTLLGLFLLSACATPPEDLPRAEQPQEEDQGIPELPPPPEPPAPIDTAANQQESDDDLQEAGEESTDGINTGTSTFGFEGYGPGKSHEGVFDDWQGELVFADGVVVGASGTIQAESVNTGIEDLDAHLKKDDFFAVESHPEISFASSSITADTMTGDLSFLGVTKQISFPVTHTDGGISADFVLDTTPFGMENNKVNKEVRIFFTLSS